MHHNKTSTSIKYFLLFVLEYWTKNKASFEQIQGSVLRGSSHQGFRVAVLNDKMLHVVQRLCQI